MRRLSLTLIAMLIPTVAVAMTKAQWDAMSPLGQLIPSLHALIRPPTSKYNEVLSYTGYQIESFYVLDNYPGVVRSWVLVTTSNPRTAIFVSSDRDSNSVIERLSLGALEHCSRLPYENVQEYLKAIPLLQGQTAMVRAVAQQSGNNPYNKPFDREFFDLVEQHSKLVKAAGSERPYYSCTE